MERVASHRDEQGGHGVGGLVPGVHEQEAHEHGQRAGEVGAEVERVGGERRRSGLPRGAEARERPRGVHQDHDAEHRERPPGHVHVVAVLAADQPLERLVGDEQGDQDQERALSERG
jgi:hypothetical protein